MDHGDLDLFERLSFLMIVHPLIGLPIWLIDAH
jgi:hypothetical protein